eukprot:GCRY01003175.1.p1 GENE.GCRY01003175.1~~GCRY01003175.1.p1  ORF type:complete len:499 (+),score=92.48 GCRY01003175.1:221-1498(+)
MGFPQAAKSQVRKQALDNFLRYVKVNTQSSFESSASPSTSHQLNFLNILKKEIEDLDLKNIHFDPSGLLFGTLPASSNASVPPIGFLVHVDTSPDSSGENVQPRVVNYTGKSITYPHGNQDLNESLSPELSRFMNENIIVTQGDTLLGADDKAGIAALMSSLSYLKNSESAPHGEVFVAFTCDEEVGRGTEVLSKYFDKLPHHCVTVDGGTPGEISTECFDAWKVVISFSGVVVHPGEAKGRLVNAAHLGARLLSEIPVEESPEHTSGRQGFFYVHAFSGDTAEATAQLLLRDFDASLNQKRVSFLETLAETYQKKYAGLKVDVKATESYQNMGSGIDTVPELVDVMREAVRESGASPFLHPIRGGTDGAMLTAMGHPTPNLFAGGHLMHSTREWIPEIALQQCSVSIVHIIQNWYFKHQPEVSS